MKHFKVLLISVLAIFLLLSVFGCSVKANKEGNETPFPTSQHSGEGITVTPYPEPQIIKTEITEVEPLIEPNNADFHYKDFYMMEEFLALVDVAIYCEVVRISEYSCYFAYDNDYDSINYIAGIDVRVIKNYTDKELTYLEEDIVRISYPHSTRENGGAGFYDFKVGDECILFLSRNETMFQENSSQEYYDAFPYRIAFANNVLEKSDKGINGFTFMALAKGEYSETQGITKRPTEWYSLEEVEQTIIENADKFEGLSLWEYATRSNQGLYRPSDEE